MDKKLLVAKPVSVELEKFNAYYRESVFSNNQRIQKVIDHIMKSDGKKIRPILLLLAAKACGDINPITYNSAITVELLHTASLIHDDVVDESSMRRGKPSLNAVFDNKMSILVGDYFLSTALMKAVLTGNINIISDVSSLGRALAEGEITQLSLVKEMVLDEEEYFEVIKKKTASLMSTCMKIGAISAGGTSEEVGLFRQLGEYLGICFQLRDDIFDYFKDNVGKPTGNDIREGKVTLPLLYALNVTPSDKSAEMLRIVSSKDFSDENVAKLMEFAKANGGIDYAYQKIESYRNRIEELISKIDNEDVKEALYVAIDYIVERIY